MVQELSELRKTLEGDKLAETEESFSLLPHYYPELLELVTTACTWVWLVRQNRAIDRSKLRMLRS